jgi:hypothetical protein
MSPSDSVTAVLVVLAVAVALTLTLVGATWWWARTISGKVRQQDHELRPVEEQTGRCGACDGAGTRIEVFAGRSASQSMVTCFRCGGTGEPPEAGRIPDLMPSPLGLHVRQLWGLRRSLG